MDNSKSQEPAAEKPRLVLVKVAGQSDQDLREAARRLLKQIKGSQSVGTSPAAPPTELPKENE